MNWEAVGAMAEIIGAFAILATLGYLILQIRQGNASLKASTSQRLSQSFSDKLQMIGSDETLSGLFNRGMQDISMLDDGEVSQFSYLVHAWAREYENAYYQYRTHAMDESTWQGWHGGAIQFLGSNGVKEIMMKRLHVYDPEFVEYMRAEIFTQEILETDWLAREDDS